LSWRCSKKRAGRNGSTTRFPRRRLHDTIKSLNRNQTKDVLRFKGDGTGEGILWEFVDGAANRPLVD